MTEQIYLLYLRHFKNNYIRPYKPQKRLSKFQYSFGVLINIYIPVPFQPLRLEIPTLYMYSSEFKQNAKLIHDKQTPTKFHNTEKLQSKMCYSLG